MFSRRRAVALSLVLYVTCIHAGLLADDLPYRDSPEIVTALKALDGGQSLALPPVNVNAGDFKYQNMDRYGPGQRDYCNKMVYALERPTVLYCGGNHQVPHRMNDVWEYHLGSNTWHLLYAPDGGNAGQHKGAYFLTSRTLVAKPDTKLDEKQLAQIEAYGKWWKENVIFKDGHLTTTRGGPIMPAHTWDAFTYDAKAKKLLWGMGVSPAGQLSTHAYYTGTPLKELEKQTDPNYTEMWMFDPVAKKWSHYRTDKPHAQLRGMGATMCYLPDEEKSIWYVAAQNVSPAAYEMWTFDAARDTWAELKPGGKSIDTLATKDKVAPMSEVQSAYSPKHKKLVAVLERDTFVYDVVKNEWAKAVTDDRIYAHDARSVFVYDSHADVFLLAFPPDGRGKELKFAAYSLNENRWEMIEPKGDPMAKQMYGGHMGYYDPQHNVMVIQGRGTDRMWVYRHRR